MAFQVYTIFIIHKTVIVYISDTFHPFDLRRKHRLGTNSQGCCAIWNESRNHIKQTSKQKHFSTTTPCRPPSRPFAIVSIHQFLHAFFFHPNPTTEQRTAQKFPFGLRCATGLTVSCIITLLCLAWWRSAWAGLHATLRFTISLLCHANDKSGHACCHNILRHYEILATKIKAILSLLLFVHLFLSNAEIICHHLVTK